MIIYDAPTLNKVCFFKALVGEWPTLEIWYEYWNMMIEIEMNRSAISQKNPTFIKILQTSNVNVNRILCENMSKIGRGVLEK